MPAQFARFERLLEVIGNAQDELVETYDQYDYRSEMADALERLAELIEQIVDPQPNVVAMVRQ